MLSLILSLAFFLNVHAATPKEVNEAKASLLALLKPLLQGKAKKDSGSSSSFSLEKCEKHKINWMAVLFMQEEGALTYKFRPGCDIEGTLKPTIIKPFPADLKLRNLENYHRIQTENKVTTSLEAKPVLHLEVRSGQLTGKKGKVLFEADYRVRMDPLKKNDPVKENLGGEMRIHEIFGKKVSIKEKIYVQ